MHRLFESNNVSAARRVKPGSCNTSTMQGGQLGCSEVHRFAGVTVSIMQRLGPEHSMTATSPTQPQVCDMVQEFNQLCNETCPLHANQLASQPIGTPSFGQPRVHAQPLLQAQLYMHNLDSTAHKLCNSPAGCGNPTRMEAGVNMGQGSMHKVIAG